MHSTFGSPYPNGSILDELYQKYHDSGFSAKYFFEYYAPQFYCAFIGVLLNLSFIFVSIKSRSKLHNPFNVFIAYESFTSILFSYAYLAVAFLPLSGQNVAHMEICILLKLPGVLGVLMQSGMMFFISLERLICIVFPLCYQNIKFGWKKFYIQTVLFLDAAFSGTMVSLIYSNTLPSNENYYYLCNFNDIYTTNAKKCLYQGVMFAQILTFSIYAIILLLMIKARIQRIKLMDTKNMQILCSLNVIMAIIFFGWLINTTSPFYVALFKISDADWLKINPFIASTTILASSLNGPVLFALSQEYRKCYENVFPWLFKRNQTQPTLAIQVISSTAGRIQQQIPN